MTLLSLQEAMRLHGIEGWTLTEPQKRFVMRSTSRLVEKYGVDWFIKSRPRLLAELEFVLGELGPIIK